MFMTQDWLVHMSPTCTRICMRGPTWYSKRCYALEGSERAPRRLPADEMGAPDKTKQVSDPAHYVRTSTRHSVSPPSCLETSFR